MSYTQQFSEYAAVLAKLNPGQVTAETNTGYVSFANYHRGVIVIQAGVIAADVDVDIEQATDTSGTSAKTFDSGGKDITLTTTTDNNTVSIIEVHSDEFDIANAFDCLNLEVTSTNAYLSAIIYGIESRFMPVPTTNVDSVTD